MIEKKRWRLCFVCPRYKTDHAGGAEILTEKLSKRLAKEGHSVEVFTTCAQDHYTWKNYYKPEAFYDEEIRVSRFRVDEERDTARFLQIQKKLDLKMDLSKNEEITWINESVHSTNLYNEIEKRKNDFDWFIFAPYLFGITYRGSLLFPDKSLLIPCLHDEPFAYLSIFSDMFDKASGILFNSLPEKELAQKIYNIDEKKNAIVGMGFDTDFEKEVDVDGFKKKYGLTGKKYILYAGRREPGKNTPLLIDYVCAYNKNNENNINLILIGTGDVQIPPEEEKYIQDLGFLSVQEKNSAYKAADIFCQPSINESLSIVIMESWLARTPVLVNGKCNVTSFHCRKSNGGLLFNNFYEFCECVNLLLNNGKLNAKMAVNGEEYVREEYSWKKVVSSLEMFLEKITS